MLQALYTIITHHFWIHLEPQHEVNTPLSIQTSLLAQYFYLTFPSWNYLYKSQ